MRQGRSPSSTAVQGRDAGNWHLYRLRVYACLGVCWAACGGPRGGGGCGRAGTGGAGGGNNVLYRFDGGASLFRADVREALLALGAGCHELEIAESGISTHWSGSYEFCFVSSTPTPTPTSSIPAIPTGLWVAKVDIPFAPDDIDVHWNAVAGATWYELWYHDGVQWQLKATTTRSAYRDESPSLLFADSYSVKACNNVGCSAFSAAVTQY